MIKLWSLLLALTVAAAPAAGDGDPRTRPRTAVAVTLESGELPAIRAMQSWFVSGDEPLVVVSAERGPAEVVVVRDPAVQPHLDLMAKGFLDRALGQRRAPVKASSRRTRKWSPHLLAGGAEALVRDGGVYFRTSKGRPEPADLETARDQLRAAFDLGDGVRLRFVSPLAAPVSRTALPMNIFNQTLSFPTREEGFLTFVEKLPAPLGFAYRVSDAVALAGRELHASGRRRALLVLIDGASPDDSFHSAAEVAEELAQLQVPVFVGSFGRGTFAAHWSGERLITSQPGLLDAALDLARFEAACDELRTHLEAQRVVWLEGRHARVRLTEAAAGVRLAGEIPELTSTPSKVRAVQLQRRKGLSLRRGEGRAP